MKKVLIVEDELVIAMINQRMVENLGYRSLEVATNGRDAMKLVENEAPDLILMDIMIEGDLDGIQTAEKIRKQFKIPVIFVTGNSDDAVRNRAEKVENSVFLVKPVNHNMLKSSIDKISLH